MPKAQDGVTRKSERTLLLALLMSAPGPLVTGIAAITSRSTTQLADFVRRTAELVATFVSWWVFRRVANHPDGGAAYKQKMERIANRTVAVAMLFSGVALLAVGVIRLFVQQAGGRSVLGLVIAALGLVVNTAFFFRYRGIVRRQYDAVIAAQQKLYQAKAIVDVCVVAALAMVTFLPLHPATKYIDAVGSMAVALYLLYSGARMYRQLRQQENGGSAA